MDAEFARLVDLDTPKLNPVIANGLAVEHMRGVEEYIDSVFHSVAKEFPEGLKYEGGHRCRYPEAYRETIRKRGTRSTYDMARSDFYMMRYDFSFKGEKLKSKYIYLPFVTENSTIHISNSRYLVSPVLTDRVISIGVNNIFIRLLRDRMTFERTAHHFEVNGKGETADVAWVNAYHKTEAMKKLKRTVNMQCSLVHYLFCKYGFTETFKRFGCADPIVGYAPDITREKYPRDQWVICSSMYTNTTMKPKGAPKGYYAPTMIRVAIRREEWANPIVRSLVGGFFYVVDHFPDRVEPEFIGSPHEKRLWMILLGHIIFSGTVNEGKLLNDIDAHIVSLDDYIDNIMIARFREIGMPMTDLWQLFGVLIENFKTWILDSANKVNSMYDKELNVIGFVLESLTFLIIKLNFRLKAAAKKEQLKLRDVENALQVLKTGAIFSLTKTCGCLSTTSSPGDNKAFKSTAILIPQSASHKGAGSKDRGAITDQTKRLHVSVAEIGGYSNIPKSEPSGRSRLNPHVQLTEKFVVVRNEELRPLLDNVQQLIKRI